MLTLEQLFVLLAESERQLACAIEAQEHYNTIEFFREVQHLLHWRSSIKDEIIRLQAEALSYVKAA